MSARQSTQTIRPYQLACLICRAGNADPGEGDDRIAELAQLIRRDPDIPLTLCANVGDVCAYQDPGPAEDTPGSAEFNAKRDIDLLLWLDLLPGCTLPARLLLKRLLLRVPTVRGICGYEDARGPVWEGCPKAESGDYERGREWGIESFIPPRPREQMEADKQRSMAAVTSGEVIPIRPHILLCSVCQYAGGARPPFAEDNLPELLQLALEPGCTLQVKLVPGADWTICAPCPNRSRDGCCVNGKFGSGGLGNVARDLRTLHALGVGFGTVMDVRAMYRLLFERIPTVDGVCTLHIPDVPESSIWWDNCCRLEFPSSYEKGREMLMGRFEDG